MITERFSVRVSIPLKSGARAEAEFKLGDQHDDLSQQQAMEVKKALHTAAALGEVEMYTSIVKVTTDDSYKPV